MPAWHQPTSPKPLGTGADGTRLDAADPDIAGADGIKADGIETPASLDNIRAYYEQNTAWFGMVQRRNHDLAIHRPVWAEQGADRQRALNYVNAQIAAHMEPVVTADDPATLLDLGCGFGATLFYLGDHFAAQASVTGVTISPQQAQLVRQRILAAGSPNCAVVEADFQAVPVATGVDAICSVEAFAHAYAPERYLDEAARLLRPGGRLILCDDFRADDASGPRSEPADARWIDLFQRGWHIPHLLSSCAVTDLARGFGLVKIHDTDFSPHLRMRTFPAAAIPLFELIMDHGGAMAAVLESVLGGFALEECIRQGLVEYRFLVFEKQAG